MNDETIRLVLDLASSNKDVGELSTKLHTLDKDLEEAGSQAATFAGSTRRLRPQPPNSVRRVPTRAIPCSRAAGYSRTLPKAAWGAS